MNFPLILYSYYDNLNIILNIILKKIIGWSTSAKHRSTNGWYCR